MDDALRYALEEFESIEPPADLWERITRRSPVAEPTPARRRSPRLAAAAVVCVLLAVAAIAGVIASRHGRGPASAIPAAPTLPTDLRPGSIGGDGNYPAPRYALDQLAAVSAASSADAWLVGAKPLPSPSGRRPLAWHWDGHRWTDVAVTIADQRSAFTAVTTVSADDAWAVGVTSDNGADQYGRPLVMHWNGRAWRPAAMPGVASGVLYGVDAVGPDDVWAVGGTGTGYRMRAPLVEHWNGTRWTRVPLPELGAGAGALVTVDAVAANDVWIANAPSGGSTRSVVLHWDGVRLVRLPDPFGARDPAASITAVSATDAWAVGSYVDHPRCANAHTLPLAAHWDGRRWARVAPALAGTDTALGGVTTIGAGDVLAVGTTATFHYSPDACHAGSGGFGISGSLPRLVLERWNGTRWAIVPGPVRELFTGIPSLAPDGAGGAWIVGSDEWSAIVARLTGGAWHVAPHPPVHGRR